MKLKFIIVQLILFSAQPTYSQFTQYSSGSSSSSFGEECYCYFESDYSAMITAWNQIIEIKRQAWLNERTQVFKEEIEARLNENFSNFEDAQRAFFKERIGNNFIQITLNDKEDYFNNRIYAESLDRQITFARTKALELRLSDLTYNTNIYYFGDIMYYGEKFMDKTWSYINSSYYNRLSQYDEATNNTESLLLQRDKLTKVIQDETFDDFVVDQYMSHYNNQDLLGKAEVMSIYMIADNLGPLEILYQTAQEKLYNPFNYSYSNGLQQIINNTSVNSNYNLPDPELSTDEIIKRFAITSLDPYESGYTTISDYIFEDDNLSAKTGNYLNYHSFDSRALNTAKEFFSDVVVSNQNFSKPISFYQKNFVGKQTEDRETRVYSNDLTFEAETQNDFARFTDVIDAFANPENYAKEGFIMREMITSNNLNIPSELNDYDLGKLFDFETNTSFIRIKFSEDTNYGSLFHGDYEYGWDLFEDPFKILVLDELAKGGYASFNDEIILTKSFQESIGKCVYEYMKSVNPFLFRTTIRNFLNNNEHRLIITTYQDINDIALGRTDGSRVSDGIVKIRMNTARLSSNPIDWAATLLHEGLHAEMYRFVETKEPGINPGDRERIMQLLLYYKGSEWGDDTTVQHMMISEKFVVPIAEALRELDNYQYPVDYYMGFAWTGLLDDTPNNLLPTSLELSDWAVKETIVKQNHTMPCP